MADAAGFTAGTGERVAAQTHRENSRRVPQHLRIPAGARRACARPGLAGEPQAGRPADAPGRDPGLYRRRRHGCTVRDPDAVPSTDLVNRRFTVEGPNVLWITDITEHRTREGKLYC